MGDSALRAQEGDTGGCLIMFFNLVERGVYAEEPEVKSEATFSKRMESNGRIEGEGGVFSEKISSDF